MLKTCENPRCGRTFEGRPNQKYCSPKCKKDTENASRGRPSRIAKNEPPKRSPILPKIKRPPHLNEIAAAYWDKISPTLIKRGHLNILSEDAFAELCDLYSRLVDINRMIDNGTVIECEECGAAINLPANRALLQLDDKWTINDGTQTRTFKESALSDLKRKYSARFLDYCKQFYLTPAANRGNFGLEEIEENGKNDESDGMFD